MTKNTETTKEHTFVVEQGGLEVASGFAPTYQEARREGLHYAMMYSQDGGVRLTINGEEVYE